MWRWRLSEQGVFAWTEYFALRRDLLLPTVAKVGKSTGRNLRFLHLPARYAWYRIENACRTFTGNFLFSFSVIESSLLQRRCR